MVLTVLLIVTVILSVAVNAVQTEEGVYLLNTQNFEEVINQHDYLLVYYYDPQT